MDKYFEGAKREMSLSDKVIFITLSFFVILIHKSSCLHRKNKLTDKSSKSYKYSEQLSKENKGFYRETDNVADFVASFVL